MKIAIEMRFNVLWLSVATVLLLFPWDVWLRKRWPSIDNINTFYNKVHDGLYDVICTYGC